MKINVKLCKMHLLKHETFRTLVLVILIGADLTQSHSCFIATSLKLNFNSEDISWGDNFLFLSFHEKKIICNLWFFFACNFLFVYNFSTFVILLWFDSFLLSLAHILSTMICFFFNLRKSLTPKDLFAIFSLSIFDPNVTQNTLLLIKKSLW